MKQSNTTRARTTLTSRMNTSLVLQKMKLKKPQINQTALMRAATVVAVMQMIRTINSKEQQTLNTTTNVCLLQLHVFTLPAQFMYLIQKLEIRMFEATPPQPTPTTY